MIDSEIKDPVTLDPDLRDLFEQERATDRDFVYCATCSAVIGRNGDRIEVNGSHDHRFTNPYGFLFHVGCFRDALGCNIVGAPEAADSWFAGFQWRMASCGECKRHLGWYFDRVAPDAANDYFYGLILGRIQSE